MSPDHTVPPGLAEALRDRYELIRETGHGGSATVYLARDLKHDRFVALKVLNPDVAASAGDRFLREIQVSAGMQHPHILPTYDSGLVQGRLYFVMPFVDGGSLRQRLDAATALPVDEALRIAHDIAVALAHAHDLGIVHRDVKPENILFYHGHACLADFGVARAIEQMGATITAHGTIVGTPAYMSPEQFASADFDGRSDVYSLACVLFEMIAGTRVFAGETAREVVRQRQRSAPSIRRVRDQVPLEVDALLARALATLPEDRYTDARAFAAAIEQTALALKESARDSAPRRAMATLRRRPRWAWVAATVGLAASIGLAFTPLRDEVIARMPAVGGSRVPTTGFRPFDAGTLALSSWDVSGAQRSFADAITIDPTFAPAHLWNAQALALARQAGTDEFRAAIMRLAGVRAELRGRDSLLAAGLIALGERQFPRACEIYESLRARDSLDVLAWYGLGDCHSLDSAVVRDARSSSGWAFRSSWHAAASAYMRAATIEPSAHNAVPFALVTRLLPTDPVYIRLGRTLATPQQLMLAHPSLAGDTLAWIPFPAVEFQRSQARAIAGTHPDALQRNRQVLLAFARQWTAAAPRNPDAHEALALAREAREELGEDGAIGAMRRALALSSAPAQRVRVGAAVARLHIKRAEFARARAVADSMLAADSAGATTDVARQLAGLAALTARPALAAELRLRWALPGYADMNIPPPVAAVASRYLALAASGACDDSLRALGPRIEALLESHAPANQRADMRGAAIGRAAALAYPCLGASVLRDIAPVGPLDRAQRAHAAGNARLTRAILDSLAVVRRVLRPGDVTIQDTYLEAALRVAVGDTTAAIRQLDLVLSALPTLGTVFTREEPQAAAVGRAFALRADLAAATGDAASARRWASHALALWSGGEPVVAPAITRLRALASR